MPSFYLYGFAFLIAVYLLIGAYIRIKMHFWHTQPVFHIYNLKYWLKPPGIINKGPPGVNKFVNLTNNELLPIDYSGNTVSQVCQFISDYYIIHDAATYKPSEQDILAYLQCSNQPAFFNIYREPRLYDEGEIIGVISTRALNVSLKNKPTLLVYYVDNLCVKPGYRKKGIAPEMIQSFYYRMARNNPRVNAYMFKREGKLNAIVPLVYYDTYIFDMTQFRVDYVLTAAMRSIEIGVNQMNLFVAFIKEQTPNFECVILADVSNLLNLIKLGKLKIYGVLFNGELIAAYVFRPLALYYGDKKATECITILSNCKDPDVLITGFTMSWQTLNTPILILEETAHSKPVVEVLKKNPTVVLNFKSPTAFFLYNYACYSVKNTNTLLLY